jgi:hypothetical protein
LSGSNHVAPPLGPVFSFPHVDARLDLRDLVAFPKRGDANPANGRTLTDDVPDVFLALLSNATVSVTASTRTSTCSTMSGTSRLHTTTTDEGSPGHDRMRGAAQSVTRIERSPPHFGAADGDPGAGAS